MGAPFALVAQQQGLVTLFYYDYFKKLRGTATANSSCYSTADPALADFLATTSSHTSLLLDAHAYSSRTFPLALYGIPARAFRRPAEQEGFTASKAVAAGSKPKSDIKPKKSQPTGQSGVLTCSRRGALCSFTECDARSKVMIKTVP